MEAKDENGDSPLLIAVKNTNYGECDLLLDQGIDVNVTDKFGESPLHIAISWRFRMIEDSSVRIAIRERQIRLIEKLLDKGADIEAKNKFGTSPLLSAVNSRYDDVCYLLLDRGADVNVTDESSNSLLHIVISWISGIIEDSPEYSAIRERQKRLIEKLLDKGADIEAKNKSGTSPLLSAVNSRYDDVCYLLLDRGADVNVTDESSNSPLHIISWISRSFSFISSSFGDISEYIAISGRRGLIEKLLDKGANIEAKDQYGRSPLLSAVLNKYDDLCYLLLDRGADVNVTDETSNSPLHIAISWSSAIIEDSREYIPIRGRQMRLIEKLLDKGADMEAKDKCGRSPLLSAVNSRNDDVCYLLLDRGADVNVTDESSNSPLHIAILWSSGIIEDHRSPDYSASLKYRAIRIRGRQIRLIEKLLDKGADIEAKDQFGYSALLIAIKGGNYDTCHMLLDRGADVNVKCLEGQTPLHIARCCYNYNGPSSDCKYCIIEQLLLWGGSMLLMDNNGKTPLDSVKSHNVKVLKTLKRHVTKLKPKEFKMHLDFDLECELNKLFESPQVLRRISRVFDDEEYFTCCLQELEKMKTKMFGCHSLYNYYLSSKRNYPTYVTNYELVQAIETKNLDLEFPIYAALVKVTFSKAKRRRTLLDAAQLLVNIPLPNEIVREILSHLSNDELKAIIEASEQL